MKVGEFPQLERDARRLLTRNCSSEFAIFKCVLARMASDRLTSPPADQFRCCMETKRKKIEPGMQARSSLIRLMACVGGLPVQPQPPSRRRDAVLTQGPPVSPTQCVAPWPPTHPCGAPAPLSLPVDCDRGQRRLSQSATSSHIHHRSFRFLWIATPPSFSQLSRFVALNQHPRPTPPRHTS